MIEWSTASRQEKAQWVLDRRQEGETYVEMATSVGVTPPTIRQVALRAAKMFPEHPVSVRMDEKQKAIAERRLKMTELRRQWAEHEANAIIRPDNRAVEDSIDILARVVDGEQMDAMMIAAAVSLLDAYARLRPMDD